MRLPRRDEVKDPWQVRWCREDDVRCHFNPNARKSSVFGYRLRFDALLSLIRSRVPKGGRVLEYGPAQGNFALTLAEEGYRVTAVDLQQGFLDYARLKYEKGEVEFLCGNFMDFSRPGAFDAVLCGEIIEHVAYPRDLLRSAWRNLKPGGIVALSTPNGAEEGSPLPTFSQVKDPSAFIPRQFHWGDHVFLYTREELESLGDECGFSTFHSEAMDSRQQNRLKAVRYLMPLSWLHALEKWGRTRPIKGRASTRLLIHGYRKEARTPGDVPDRVLGRGPGAV